MAAKKRKSGACRVVKFKGGKTVKFCAKSLSPAKMKAKKARARRALKAHACKSSAHKSYAGLKKACKKLAA